MENTNNNSIIKKQHYQQQEPSLKKREVCWNNNEDLAYDRQRNKVSLFLIQSTEQYLTVWLFLLSLLCSYKPIMHYQYFDLLLFLVYASSLL